MAVDLLSDPDAAGFDLTSLVAVSGGGAQMPKAVADRLHALTGIDYIEGYGLTETIAPTHINPYHRPKRQCGGIPIFDTDSRSKERRVGKACVSTFRSRWSPDH